MQKWVIAVWACIASAQVPSSFEVASVKVSDLASNAIGGYDGFRRGAFSIRNVTLQHLIQIAYGVREYQVLGGPGWISSERYNVDAKPATPVDDGQARLMLQRLLEDRFGVRVHRETKMVSGYTLGAEKGESRLHQSTAAGVGFRIMSMEEISGPGTMTMLASVLKGILGTPVEDRTGLTGKYDIELKWVPDNAPPERTGPSILSAIREQLGLSLKAGKVPVEMIVVDAAEKRPVEN